MADSRRHSARRVSGSRTRARNRPGWRRRLDALGGPLLVGSVLAVLGLVLALILVNRPADTPTLGNFEPVVRGQVVGRQWGDPAAPVRIVAFEDFQCPFCARYTHDSEPLLASEFIESGQVSYEFHHLAFLGPESILAAQAAECALEQDQFWPYHDLLFQQQGRENSGVFAPDRLKLYGLEVGAALPAGAWDQDAFAGCLDSGRSRAAVERLTAQAQQAGVRSTPSFMINGRIVTGVQTIDELRGAIRAALAAAP